jgi:hypothetical protein
MRRTTGIRAVLACTALGSVPLVAAGSGGGDDPTGAGLPALHLTMRDDAVAGLPGAFPAGPVVVAVSNDAASPRSFYMARLDGDELRVAARTGALAPGQDAAVTVRLEPGRWIAAEAGVSRAPAAVTLVPATANGAPR